MECHPGLWDDSREGRNLSEMLERQWGRLGEDRRLARFGKMRNGEGVWGRQEGKRNI